MVRALFEETHLGRIAQSGIFYTDFLGLKSSSKIRFPRADISIGLAQFGETPRRKFAPFEQTHRPFLGDVPPIFRRRTAQFEETSLHSLGRRTNQFEETKYSVRFGEALPLL